MTFIERQCYWQYLFVLLVFFYEFLYTLYLLSSPFIQHLYKIYRTNFIFLKRTLIFVPHYTFLNLKQSNTHSLRIKKTETRLHSDVLRRRRLVIVQGTPNPDSLVPEPLNNRIELHQDRGPHQQSRPAIERFLRLWTGASEQLYSSSLPILVVDRIGEIQAARKLTFVNPFHLGQRQL